MKSRRQEDGIFNEAVSNCEVNVNTGKRCLSKIKVRRDFRENKKTRESVTSRSALKSLLPLPPHRRGKMPVKNAAIGNEQ